MAIIESLEKIIGKLDAITEAETPSTGYGLTIEDRLDHIAKQLDKINGGGSGSGGNANVVTIPISIEQGHGGYYLPVPDITYAEFEEIYAGLDEHGIIKFINDEDTAAAEFICANITITRTTDDDVEYVNYCLSVCSNGIPNEGFWGYGMFIGNSTPLWYVSGTGIYNGNIVTDYYEPTEPEPPVDIPVG